MKKVVITILLLLLAIVNGNTESFLGLNSANSVTGVLGEDYTFTCLLDSAAVYSTFKWKLGDGGAINESMQGDLTNRVYYYIGHIDGLDSVTLVIKNTVSTDFANYTCEVNVTNQIMTVQLSFFGKL